MTPTPTPDLLQAAIAKVKSLSASDNGKCECIECKAAKAFLGGVA